MSGNNEHIRLDPIAFDSYGALMRNLLTPYQNLICIIKDWLSGELDEDIIKKRFSDDVIKELIDIKWWNYDESIIRTIYPLLTDRENPIESLKKVQEILYNK